MPSSGTRYETATVFGALDSAFVAAANGENAHLIREVSRNSNRIHTRGMPIFSCQWNPLGDPAASDPGILADYGTYPQWQKLWPLPLPVPHQPQLRLAWVDIRATISNGDTIYLQIGTSAIPFNSAASLTADNVIALTGTGSLEAYSSAGILPLGSGALEFLDFGVLSPSAQTVADAGDVGTPSGTTTAVSETLVVDEAAVFSSGLDTGRYTIAFFDDDGAFITSRRILRRGSPNVLGLTLDTDTALQVSPEFPGDEGLALWSTDYEIWDAIPYRLISIVVTEADGSAF